MMMPSHKLRILISRWLELAEPENEMEKYILWSIRCAFCTIFSLIWGGFRETVVFSLWILLNFSLQIEILICI